MYRSLKFALSASVSLYAIVACASAQAAVLRGAITEAPNNLPTPGATVRIEGGDTVTAGPDGVYALRDLKPGTYTLVVDYVGLASVSRSITIGAADSELNIALPSPDAAVIVVTGQRAADRRALQVKKSALTLIEVLQANDVGKLPDQNVAEAVKRLPGISVANDQGEGRYVIIRGVDPKLANVTVNGQTQPAPEPESRQVKLDDIPSALIQSVQIVKALTPDLDANAIAGQVNIDTASAFDRNKPIFASARAAVGWSHINGKSPHEEDASIGGLFGPDRQFGVIVAANYSHRPIESWNFGSGGPIWTTLPGGQVVPSMLQVRDYNLVRERTGFVTNLDWRPSDTMKLYLRSTYSKFGDHETRDRLQIDAAKGVFTPASATSGAFTKATDTAALRLRSEDDDTLSISGGGAFELPKGHLDVQAAYSRASKKDPIRSEYQFKTSANIAGSYDASSALFLFTPGPDAYDGTKYNFSSVNYDTRQAVETLKQIRADYRLPFEVMGEDSELKIGAKYIDRLKTNNRDILSYKAGSTAFTVAAGGQRSGAALTYDDRYTVAPRLDYNALQAYVAAHPTALALDMPGSIGNSLANDYRVTENIGAIYGMVTFKHGPWTVIPGVRVENTNGSYAAKSFNVATSTFTQNFNSFGKHSYTDVFPGVNVRYDYSRALVFRAAITTSIGRPDYNQLTPFVNLDTGGKTVALGNAGLKPLHSVNYDISAEYYLPSQGVISLGFFHKDITNPIYTQVRAGLAGESFAGAAIDPSYSVTQFVNARKAVLTGVELNAQTQFGFLPGAFSGLGVAGNVTLVDAHAEGVPGRLDGSTNGTPLSFQSHTVATAQLFYEKYGFSARLAYSYRSHYLDTLGAYKGFSPAGVADPKSTDNITADNGQLDAKASYAFSRQAMVFVEGANLNNVPWRRYVANPRYIIENEQYGYTLRFGVQLTY